MTEDHYAAWAWAALAVIVFCFVLAFDLWAHSTGHKMMTTQFRSWLHGEVTGPLIFAAWVGLFTGLTFHFLIRAGKP